MPAPAPVKVSLQASAKTSRTLDVSFIILPLLLLGFLLARFAAPFFKLLPACTFRQALGVPCPTCGATRAGLALAQGDISLALSYNPLFVISLGMLFGWSVCRMLERWIDRSIFARFLNSAPSGEMRFATRQQQWLRGLVIGAIVLNWLYLMVTML